MKSGSILRGLGIVMAVTSVAAGVFFVSAVRALGLHSNYYVTRFYGEKQQGNTDYAALLDYAKQITEGRNQSETIYIVVILALILGWSATIYALGAPKKKNEN